MTMKFSMMHMEMCKPNKNLLTQTPPDALIFARLQVKQFVEVVTQVAQNPVQAKQLFPFKQQPFIHVRQLDDAPLHEEHQLGHAAKVFPMICDKITNTFVNLYKIQSKKLISMHNLQII
ncbi:hypothetical protein pb186bvf_009033 [Paramecium bursaria]